MSEQQAGSKASSNFIEIFETAKPREEAVLGESTERKIAAGGTKTNKFHLRLPEGGKMLGVPKANLSYSNTLDKISREELSNLVRRPSADGENDPSLIYKTWDPYLAKKMHVDRFLSDRKGLSIRAAQQLQHGKSELAFNDTWNEPRASRIDRRIERYQMIEAELTFRADTALHDHPSLRKIFPKDGAEDKDIFTDEEKANYVHLRKEPKVKIVQFSNISIFLCCCAVVVLLMAWKPHEHDPSTHTMFLTNYDTMVYGELCVVPCSIELDHHLPIEVVAIKFIASDIEKTGLEEKSVTLGMIAVTESGGIKKYSEVLGTVELIEGVETEYIAEYDIAKTLNWGEHSHVDLYLTDEDVADEANISLVVEVQQMSALARHKIWLSALLLVLVYVLIGLEIFDRVLIALVGSFVALLLVTLVQSPPDMGLVMTWMDEGTLSLLFGMMVIVAMLSVTGAFEWFSVRLVYFSSKEKRGNLRDCSMFKLTTSMCLFSAIVSAFLDNVTTLLLISPVSICLCNMLVGDNAYKNISDDESAESREGDTENLRSTKNQKLAIEVVKPTDDPVKTVSFAVEMTDDHGNEDHKLSILPSKSVEKLAIPLLIVNGVFGNIGGCMTLIGAIPNVIIGGRLAEYIGFTDFVINLAPAVIIMMPIVIFFLKWQFRDSLAGTYPVQMNVLYERYKIKDMQLLVRAGTVTVFVIIAFFLHPVHHRSSGWLALIGAMAILSVGASKDVSKVLHHVEWDTLLFFGGLFVLVAALSELGLIREIGRIIIDIVKASEPDARLSVACVTILWVSAVVSGFLSNIAFAATMAPVIKIVGEDPELDLPMAPLAWSLCFGTCLGGNLTLIGSAANLIAAGVAQHNGMHISFMAFFKVGAPVWVITNVIAMFWLLTAYVWLA